jgi:hypothetical protein
LAVIAVREEPASRSQKDLRAAVRFGEAHSGLTDLLIAAAFIVLLGAPVLFTQDGFSQDFTNSLWLIWVAGHHLGHSLWPSYFFSANPPGTTAGVFYPEFAFYGGPLYAAAGALSALLFNEAAIAFVIFTVAAMSAAYGGCWWLARQCGVKGLLSHVPAVVVLTSAYYATDLYGRGDWPEFVAVSSIPLLVASVTDLVRSPRLRARSVLLLMLSVLAFTGSHNLTLEWGTIVIVVVGLAMTLAYRPKRLRWRRIGAVAGLAVIAAGLNGWFLAPDIAYAGRTLIAGGGFDWAYTNFFDGASVYLDPLRMVPSQSSTPALYAQAPVWFILWGAITSIWLWRQPAMERLRPALLIILVSIFALLCVMIYQWPWEQMPAALQKIQFPYRLSSYLTYLGVGLTIIALLALQRTAARGQGSVGTLWSLRTLLVEALVVSVIMCVWQLWVPNTHQNSFYRTRSNALISTTRTPRTWGSAPDYGDNSLPIVPTPPDRTLTIDAGLVNAAGDHASADVAAPPGTQPILSNILAGPYLVDVKGVRIVGRNENHLVVARLQPGSGAVHITLSTRSSRAVVLGRALSAASLVALLALLVWWTVHRLRTRRRAKCSS